MSGLFANLGIQFSGKCAGELGCNEVIADSGTCKKGCSVGALRQTLGELTGLLVL